MSDDVTDRARAALQDWDRTYSVEIFVRDGMTASETHYRNAPELVRELLAEVERLRAGRANQEVLMASAADQYDKVSAEVERLRGALEALATELQAHVHTTPSDDDHEIICDVEDTIAHRIRAVLRGDQ